MNKGYTEIRDTSVLLRVEQNSYSFTEVYRDQYNTYHCMWLEKNLSPLPSTITIEPNDNRPPHH